MPPMGVWRGFGGTGRFPRVYGEGGPWGKQGFRHGSEPKARDGHPVSFSVPTERA